MKNKKKLLILLMFLVLFSCGCTKQLKDKDNKTVTNPKTGQTLTENILCRPKDEDTISKYIENEIDLEVLPACKSFSVTDGGYEGIWTSLFVKPLAWVIIKIGNILQTYGAGLIIASLLIRAIALPITLKTAKQSEMMKKAQPDLNKLEKKYAGREDKDSMMMKSQEMMAIYKKYDINPISGCLFAFLQIPLFIAFLEAINRVPAIFEENFIGFQLGTTPITGLKNGNFIYIILILLVAGTTYYSMKNNSTQDNQQMQSMNKVLFFVILITSIFMTSALNIYWITTNLFTIVQNMLVKKEKV